MQAFGSHAGRSQRCHPTLNFPKSIVQTNWFDFGPDRKYYWPVSVELAVRGFREAVRVHVSLRLTATRRVAGRNSMSDYGRDLQ